MTKTTTINSALLNDLIHKGCELMGWEEWTLSDSERLCAASYYVDEIVDGIPAGCPTERMWSRHGRRIDAFRAAIRESELEDTPATMLEDADMYAI